MGRRALDLLDRHLLAAGWGRRDGDDPAHVSEALAGVVSGLIGRCGAEAPDGDELCRRLRGHRGWHVGPAVRGRHGWPDDGEPRR